MNSTKIWHNPRCSKSREALALMQENSKEFQVVKYLDENLSIKELKNILSKLGFSSAREWMRTKEDIYKELKLKEEIDEDKLLEAMSKYPKLIERPVIIQNDKAIIARPPSLVKEFLQS